jgi:hypothetical protein
MQNTVEPGHQWMIMVIRLEDGADQSLLVRDPPILGLVLWYMHLDQAQLELAHNAHVSPWDLSPASCT